MARITYVEHSGTQHCVEVEPGMTVMQGATFNGVPGILADCGGACTCATCHVHVDPSWSDRVGLPGEAEELMLEFAAAPDETSRLSCQITVTPALDGLVVRVPRTQY